jgi:thiamine-monophosphate kinase
MKERELIDTIHALTGPEKDVSLLCGIGDDCAVVRKTKELVLLYTMDTLVESVHFEKSWHPAELLGRKAVSVNVSDIAAMGGRPLYLLFSLGLPPNFDEEWAMRLSRGVAEGCRRYDCTLIGGDTVRSPEGAVLTLSVIGEMKDQQVLYRHGAQPGDIIYVSGPLGLAAGGLALFSRQMGGEDDFSPLYTAHLDPTARVELGRILAESGLVHAMMDLSDGLATDLAHICKQSRLGARVFQEQLPLDHALKKAATLLGRDSLQWMISGGEDFELLLTVAPHATKKLQEVMANSGHLLYPIGKMIKGNGVVLVPAGSNENLSETSIDFLGFDHFNSG